MDQEVESKPESAMTGFGDWFIPSVLFGVAISELFFGTPTNTMIFGALAVILCKLNAIREQIGRRP